MACFFAITRRFRVTIALTREDPVEPNNSPAPEIGSCGVAAKVILGFGGVTAMVEVSEGV